MPIIHSAIKKLTQARKKTELNRRKKNVLKGLIDSYKKSTNPKKLSAVFSSLDKAAKTGIIHKNKANRLKSRLSRKLVSK